MVRHEDAAHLCLLTARQRGDGIADMDRAALDLALEAAELVVWTADALHGQVEPILFNRLDVDLLEIRQEHRTVVPGKIFRALRDVIALGRGDRDAHDMLEAEFLLELSDLLPDFAEALFVILHKVHLVDGKDEIADAHECADAGMAARLREHALRRIDKDDGEVGKRSTAGHVARVLLMPRRVRADKAAVVRREIAVSHIDRDALLALGDEAVQEQRVVDSPAAAADFRVEHESFFLVGIEQFRIVEQMPDERRFAIVDTAAGNEFQ